MSYPDKPQPVPASGGAPAQFTLASIPPWVSVALAVVGVVLVAVGIVADVFWLIAVGVVLVADGALLRYLARRAPAPRPRAGTDRPGGTPGLL